MSNVALHNVTKAFGDLEVLDDVSLQIEAGSFVSFIGPSGCGKTTLVRIIAGLESASFGTVRVDGAAPSVARSHKRVGLVPQQPGLLPWRTVRANAHLLLDVNRVANPPDAANPNTLLRDVGLGDFMEAYPHELSGGMQQRVALVRALALHAPLLVMDEPFAALDEITRSEMRHLLSQLVTGRGVVERTGVTVLFVTHNIAEAVALSDRVIVCSPRPAKIVADVAIDLPRPRSRDIEDDPRFVELCAEVRHTLLGAMRP